MEPAEFRRVSLALAVVAGVCLVAVRLLAFAPHVPARESGPEKGGPAQMNRSDPPTESLNHEGPPMSGEGGGGASVEEEAFEGGEDPEEVSLASGGVGERRNFEVSPPGFTGGDGNIDFAALRLEVSGPVSRYWRFDSHDEFNGRTWVRRRPDPRPFACGDVLQKPSPGSALQHFSVKVIGKESFSHIIAPLEPYKACVGNVGATFDRSSGQLTAARPLQPGFSYAVSSFAPPYTPAELRASGVEVPRQIKDRYLQLPQSNSKRVRDLALRVTEGAGNPYDKAKKIEAYLAKSGNFKYKLTPPAAPAGRDGVDWFLFDGKVGKCDYFASAMVVLLRNVGVPSRLVGGFMPGDWDHMAKKVVIKGPPHAWVEAYFPVSGWVEFEPTPSGDAPGQPSAAASAAPAGLKNTFNDLARRCERSLKGLARRAKEAANLVAKAPKQGESSGALGELEELVPCPGSSRLRHPPRDPDLRDALADVATVDTRAAAVQATILKYPQSLYRKDRPAAQGVVTRPDGRPVPGTVALYLVGDGGRAEVKVGEGSTDEQGRFDVPFAVPEGWGLGKFHLVARFSAAEGAPQSAALDLVRASKAVQAPKRPSWLRRLGTILARLLSVGVGEPQKTDEPSPGGAQYPKLQTGAGGSGAGGPRMAGPIALPDTPLMEIKAAVPRYWRETSYDTYDGSGWSQARGVRRRVGCNEELQRSPSNAKRLDISVKVLKGGVAKHLLAPLSPVRVCVGEFAATYDEEAQSLTLKAELPAGTRYTASSAVPEFSVEAIRAAPAEVPAKIRRRYLQLPGDVPARVKELAISVTAGATNNFDKAKLIEAYLGRSGRFTYALEPPPTPKGRDGVDYFLFDLKRGYCSYFSSAMAVMLRSIGVPARTVSGFAPGNWSPLNQSVTLTTPHAWVEVYVAGHGWVEFEPTPGGPAQPSRTSSGRMGAGEGRIPTETDILTSPSEFRRDEQPVITGTVRTLDGKPAGKAEVVLYLSDKHKKQGIRIGHADVDPAGDYRIAVSVAPGFKLGQYQLIARYAGNDDYLCSDSDPEIVIRAKVDLELSASPEKGALRLAGSLKDDDGKPVAGGRVSLTLSNGRSLSFVTDAAGRFEGRIPVAAGEHVVKAVFAATDLYDEASGEAVVSVAPVVVPRPLPKTPPSQVEPPQPEQPTVAEPLPAPRPKPNRARWAVWGLAFAGLVLAVWARRRKRESGIPDIGVPASTVTVSEYELDIKFPQIDSDLPLLWGTNDPPLEVVLVGPAGSRLLVDGAEKAVPTQKGEYVLAAHHGWRRTEKRLSIVDYGEEASRDFRALAERNGHDAANLTARQILERIERAQTGFRRPERLLLLFEKFVYGRQAISRTEFVDYLRTERPPKGAEA